MTTKNSFQIKSLVLRQEQMSILNEEICEILSIFKVEIEGISGTVVIRHTVNKRDVDEECCASSAELAKKLTDPKNNWLYELGMAIWGLTPESKTPSEMTDQIQRNTLHAVSL